MVILGLAVATHVRGDSTPLYTPKNPCTAEELLESCTADQTRAVFTTGFCIGFIKAWMDMSGPMMRASNTACWPGDGVSLGQIRAVVIRYTKRHPELWHEPAPAVIVRANADAFPCAR
jgi:hypothetical protein